MGMMSRSPSIILLIICLLDGVRILIDPLGPFNTLPLSTKAGRLIPLTSSLTLINDLDFLALLSEFLKQLIDALLFHVRRSHYVFLSLSPSQLSLLDIYHA